MKRFFTLFLALTMLLTLASAGAEGFPVTVTDQAGREVTIESEPQTLVSGYYISSSLLIALGQAEKLVGIEAKAGSRPIYRLSAPALLELPNVGTAKQFDLEGCAALAPDLVILPLKLKNVVEQLEELGMTVLLVNPEDQELLIGMIQLLGDATGSKEREAGLLTFIADQTDMLTAVMADAERPSVYLAGNSAILSTAGADMYQSSLIDLAGGVNAAAELTDTYWAEIDYEQLLAWNPDVILLASDAAYTCEDVLADENLADVTAVKNGAVYHMPNDAEAWDSPVPGGVLGAVWLASVLHPDLVSADMCNALIEEYYAGFYGFSFPQE